MPICSEMVEAQADWGFMDEPSRPGWEIRQFDTVRYVNIEVACEVICKLYRKEKVQKSSDV